MAAEKTLLLFGAGGFVGSHLRAAAEAEGLRVIGAGREEGRAELTCDLLDADAVRRCVEQAEPRLVVNMAGSAGVAASWEAPAESFAVNAGGVLNLLEAVSRAAPEAHVLCVSSAEVYGEPSAEKLPFREDLAPEPLSPYGASKVAMEALCGQYARARGLRVAVLRAFNQIGPGQPAAFSASGFARQIAAAELAGPGVAEVRVGNLEAARDFTDVRDTARAFLAVSRRELTGVYNLCSGRPTGLRELLDELAAATPLRVEARPDPELRRPADPSVAYGDCARLREQTGWAPRIPLRRTVADLLDWWREELRRA